MDTPALFPTPIPAGPRWLRFLGWMELLGGAFGLASYVLVSIGYPTVFPIWHNLLAVAFFGANIIAGILLLQRRADGVAWSFIVQLLQIVFWNSGIAWIARAGLHVTPVIASSGVGLFLGPSAQFFSFPVDTTSFSSGFGLGFDVTISLFLKPLSEATFACGINVVALAFTLGLWKQLSLSDHAAPTPAAPAARAADPISRWGLPASATAIALAGLFMLFSGPKAVNQPAAPLARWPLSTGDTIDVVWAGVWYEASASLVNKASVRAGRYYLVRYRSDFHDIPQDHANSAAVAQLVCRYADSLGTGRILVRPSRRAFAGLVNTALNYWFTVDTAAHCPEAAR